MEDYQTLLKKARARLPENAGNKARWKVPNPDVIAEGRMTILRNYKAILDQLRRDEPHVTKFLMGQIGTAGSLDGDRLVFTGRVTPENIRGRLDDYVASYVQCSECGAPDTHLEKDGRVQLLKCEACGAHKPIRARKARRPEAAVKEGEVYEIEIRATGQRGDGIGNYEGYTFFVAGARPGQRVKVKASRMNGKMVFADLTV